MSDFPFSIPESLASYMVQYQTAPDKTIRRLKKQLKKRGPDPVGYFLLGWFFYCKGEKQTSIEYALKAKNFAPGSPFIAKLQYFFKHPQLFNAWQTHSKTGPIKKNGFQSYSGPILELDTLIQKLSAMKTPRIQNMDAPASSAGSTLTKSSDDVEDIVSETLAKIHEQQGKLGAAIKIYQKLLHSKHGKKEYYQEQISRLKNLKKEAKD